MSYHFGLGETSLFHFSLFIPSAATPFNPQFIRATTKKEPKPPSLPQKTNRKILYSPLPSPHRRLARRGGVKRISGRIYDDVRRAMTDRLKVVSPSFPSLILFPLHSIDFYYFPNPLFTFPSSNTLQPPLHQRKNQTNPEKKKNLPDHERLHNIFGSFQAKE